MTVKLEARFLGTPIIKKNGEEVFFSYNKVNALVYYILVKGTVLRDELSGLLWGDKPEAIARKNLRNAIYEAKKILGADTFISPRKAIIKLNPQVELSLDCHAFEKDPRGNLANYEGDFLQGFFIKDSLEYEEWYLHERSRLKSIYIETLTALAREAFAAHEYSALEGYGKRVLLYNPYDEEMYALLLRAYRAQGKIQACTELYEKLRKMYKYELKTAIPMVLEEIVQQTLQKEPTLLQYAEHREKMVPGREIVWEAVTSHIHSFLRGTSTETILLVGDTGSGKSTMLELLLPMLGEEAVVLKGHCYQQEQRFWLHPWLGIVEQLLNLLETDGEVLPAFDLKRLYHLFPHIDTTVEREINLMEIKDALKFETVFHTLASILDTVTKKRKLVIAFEDIQWMDSLSLSLLHSLILQKQSERFIFCLTAGRTKENGLDYFLNIAVRQKKACTYELKPLTKAELATLMDAYSLPYPVDAELLSKLWEESKGNLFLAVEILQGLQETGSWQALTANMMSYFTASYIHLNGKQQKLLDFMALFLNGAPISMLAEYMKVDNLQILECVEQLQQADMVAPVQDDVLQPEVVYRVKHRKLKTFIQGQMSPEKWKILQAYVGDLWEKRLMHTKQDIIIYQHLEYHYEEAGELIKMGRYKLKRLMYFLNFSHELFPVLSISDPAQTGESSYFTEEATLQFLQEIESMMERIRYVHGDIDEVKQMQLMYLHLVGRYFIREGKYEQGVRFILELIEQASEMRDRDYMLTGYKQMVYYDIQTGNAVEMRRYLEMALDLAVECNYHKEVGILLRLKGLNMIMQGDFVEAERLLNESIATFMVTQTVARRYALNIAAANNYIGEIRRGCGQFAEALTYYEKALEICSKQQAFSSWVVFSCNAGIAAYNLGDYERAKKYFNDAYTLFSQYDFYWRRPIVEAYLALLAIQEGQESESLGYLQEAEKKLNLMNNPQEIGFVNMAIAYIKAKHPTSSVSLHYEDSAAVYGKVALQYLDKYRDAHERGYMESLVGTTFS